MAKYYNKLQPKLKPWPFIVIGAILLAFVLLVVLLTPSKHERLFNFTILIRQMGQILQKSTLL